MGPQDLCYCFQDCGEVLLTVRKTHDSFDHLKTWNSMWHSNSAGLFHSKRQYNKFFLIKQIKSTEDKVNFKYNIMFFPNIAINGP